MMLAAIARPSDTTTAPLYIGARPSLRTALTSSRAIFTRISTQGRRQCLTVAAHEAHIEDAASKTQWLTSRFVVSTCPRQQLRRRLLPSLAVTNRSVPNGPALARG